MRCEAWMDRTPVARKTPQQLAQDDLAYWTAQRQGAAERMAECDSRIADALERIQKHSPN